MVDGLSREDWQQVKAVFQDAVERDPSSREAFLADACGNNQVLRGAVERLLAADERNPAFLEESPVNLESLKTPESRCGEQIGPYRILEEIGRGGMGAVYLAERIDEFKKCVAIKIIRRGMDTDDMLRRFRNERQILAHLDHQNIARLLDGGSTSEGLPYFVMEYVEGRSIDEYCDEHELTINERLKLFQQVCAAVSYAHQHLAIHRDIKPSNILVTLEGVPKLLDFGIAKLLSVDAESAGTLTAVLMMTPEYASPEQARSDSTITTASDVYSLGVVLYELLTGQRPYVFPNRRPDAMARVICEAEVTRPSKAIADGGLRTADSRKGETSSDRPATSATNPQFAIRNSKFLKGDIDNIVLMALRKDPARRYSSVDQFAEDIRRYLAGLPVSARADTFRYRAGKFIQRNRAASIAVAFFFIALVAGVGATMYQAREAERQRVLAERRFNEVRELAHSVVFKYHDAIERLPGSTEVRAMLVKDALAYLDRLAQDAAEDRSLQRELALAYLKVADVQGKAYGANVGDTAGAVISSRKAIALFESLAQTAAPADVQARADLRDAYLALALTLGMGGDRQTREFVDKARSISEELATAHPEDRNHKLMFARSLILQSDATGNLTLEQHIALYQQGQALVEELVQAEPARAEFLVSLGTVHQRLGDYLRRSAKVQDKQGEEIKARVLFEQSAEHHRLSKETVQKLLLSDPENNRYQRLVAIAQNNYGEALVSAGDAKTAAAEIASALTYFTANAATDQKNLNARYELALARQTLANTLLYAGNKSGAGRELSTALKLFESLVKDDPANREYAGLTFACAVEFGDTLLAMHDFQGALHQYKSLTGQLSNSLHDVDQARSKSRLSTIHEKLGDWNAAMAEETKRNVYWQSARVEYQTALEGRGSVTDLKKKIERCDRALAGSRAGGSS